MIFSPRRFLLGRGIEEDGPAITTGGFIQSTRDPKYTIFLFSPPVLKIMSVCEEQWESGRHQITMDLGSNLAQA